MMNSVVHFEIPADDLERSKNFYKNVFGWGINAMPDMGYVLLMTTEVDEKQMPKNPGGINGGMMQRSKKIKNPVITISVSDIDEYLKKIEKAGGKTVEPKMPVGDMGFAAYFSDSEGNVVGLWQNAK